MSGGGGSSGSNTTVQQQQIPAYEQAFSQSNQDLSQSLASQPYPQYGGALIQPMNDTQTQGEYQALNAANSYQPGLYAAGSTYGNAAGLQGNVLGSISNAQTATGQGQVSSATEDALSQQQQASGAAQALASNPNSVQSYMSPYIQAALAPQISDLNLQLAQQQQGINSQAAQSGAFGDARQGAQSALQNYYGNQALNQLVGTGYNNAYTQAQAGLGQAEQTQLGAASQYGAMAQSQLGEQGIQEQAAQNYLNQGALNNTEQGTMATIGNDYANLGSLTQQLGLQGANATYNVGQQQQQQGQSELNAAYQQYLNQVNWPYQMLNVREGALSNSPYNIQTAVTLPDANGTAQGFGTLAGAAGLLGQLSGNNGSGTAPFGGSQIQS